MQAENTIPQNTIAQNTIPQSTVRRLINLRDACELVTGLRPGILLRSEAPHLQDESPAGVAWPPAFVVDLRREDERQAAHPLADTSIVVNLPLLDPALGSLRSSSAIVAEGGLAALYQFLLDQSQDRLVSLVHMVATEPAPILVHCAVGKDRTGVAVALILRLVGIDRQAVVQDYLHTQMAMQELIPRLMQNHLESCQLDPEQAARYVARFNELPPELLQANESAIEAVLDHWDSWDDGTAGWYRAHGGTSAVLEQLKQRMLLE